MAMAAVFSAIFATRALRATSNTHTSVAGSLWLPV
jgi:hypothetical protein